MIKLLISFLFFIYLFSCKTIEKPKLSNIVEKSKEKVIKTLSSNEKETKVSNKEENFIYYLIGDSYFIEGVKYIPEENYLYNKTGLATYYGKELHNVKTANNDLNKVTELLGRHKTLPLPSVVKVTNLENGLSLVIKIVDRHEDNSSILEVSRKVAQLLRFYKNEIARVRVEILADPSKQWKSVAEAMNQPEFNNTIDSAPTNIVSISNIDEDNISKDDNEIYEQPITIGSEPIEDKQLFLKIYNFKTYEDTQKILKELNILEKSTVNKEESYYNLVIGPLMNEEANKLVSSFIMKGYKKTEIIIE